MAKKKKRKKHGKSDWAEAKKLCRLSVEDVKKAKELGFSPRALIKNIPSKDQQWKAPIRVWIRDLYWERFEKNTGKERPGTDDRTLDAAEAMAAKAFEAWQRGEDEYGAEHGYRFVGEDDDEYADAFNRAFNDAFEEYFFNHPQALAPDRSKVLFDREAEDDLDDESIPF
jgi:hypothetical protein